MVINKPEIKNKKRSKPRTTTSENTIIMSSYRNDIIWNLYNSCLKQNKKEIKIYLQDTFYPFPIEYAQKILEGLKRKNTIKNYKIFIEEIPRTEFLERISDNLDLLPLLSHQDIKNLPTDTELFKYIDKSYVANVNCDPLKVLKILKNDFERIEQKKHNIKKRRDIEEFFDKEQTLKCGKIIFGLASGSFIYENIIGRFRPESQEYNLLKALMENKNKRLSYLKINQIKKLKRKSRRDISFIIRNIKRELGILKEEGGKNEDLFQSGGGYMIKD
jgi:hypothetical protein